jgi:uncharacterized cupredoxin-like copper-binding protein
MSRRRAALLAVMTGISVVLGAYGVAAARTAASASDDATVGPGLVTVRVDVRYSRFELDATRVRVGTLVRFVVRNRDPINHEFVVGAPAVHAAHAHGTEHSHPPVPGEVSVGPRRTGETIYRFDRPGTVEYACHLPRHLAYGMKGAITVVR